MDPSAPRGRRVPPFYLKLHETHLAALCPSRDRPFGGLLRCCHAQARVDQPPRHLAGRRGLDRRGACGRPRGAGGRQPERGRKESLAGRREHQHQQGGAAPSPQQRSVVPLFLRRPGRPAPGRPGQRRDRERRGLHPHQQPRGRRRGRDRGHPQRQPPHARQGDRHRPGHRPCRAQDRDGQAARDRAGQFRRAPGGRPGAGHRQSLRRGPDGHQRHRLGARAQPARHQQLRELHPDRRGHQSRQFGRRADRRQRQPAGRQHRHLFTLGRQHGHRLRDSRFHGKDRARGHREGRPGAPRLDRRRAERTLARAGRDLRREG